MMITTARSLVSTPTALPHGATLALPSWATPALADQWIGGEWYSGKALAIVASAGRLEDVPVLARQFGEWCRPCPERARIDRLTLLGMTMAPNRPPAEAKAWLHEFSRLLADLPRDILYGAIDQLQKTLKFLPTVAEIRAIADTALAKRQRLRSRLEAMARYLESGQPIPPLSPPPAVIRSSIDDQPLTPKEVKRANAWLTSAGCSTRYRDDGETFEVEAVKGEPKRMAGGPRRKPTRQDYLDLGVDPAVLDGIEAEARAG